MRLLAKTVSYGVTHLTVATGVAYALTGDLMLALGIGVIEPLVQTGVFALHDHFWERRPDKARFRIGCRHIAA